MLIVFIISLSVLLYILFGYPLVLWSLSLVASKKTKKGDIFPDVSLIISAYNEQRMIAKKIENTLALDYPKEKLEIIVASESTDKTNKIAGEYRRQGVILYEYPGREGKAATLYRTVPQAGGQIIVFSDANAMYEKDAIKKLVDNFNDERIGCVSGQLKYSNPDGSPTGFGERLYWKYEIWLKKLESRQLSLLGANGSIFAIRKELYSPMARDRGDDFELPIRVSQNGHGVVLESEAVSWERSANVAHEEFRRKVRIIAWNMKSCLLLLKECFLKKKMLLVFQLISHKLLRWQFPIFAFGLIVSTVFLPGIFFRILLALQILFIVGGGVGCLLDMRGIKVPKLLLVPYYSCMIYCGAVSGLYLLMFGKQKTMWEKVRS